MSVTLRVLKGFATRSLADGMVWGATDGESSTNQYDFTPVSPITSSRDVFTLGNLLSAEPPRTTTSKTNPSQSWRLKTAGRQTRLRLWFIRVRNFWHRHDPDLSFLLLLSGLPILELVVKFRIFRILAQA